MKKRFFTAASALLLAACSCSKGSPASSQQESDTVQDSGGRISITIGTAGMFSHTELNDELNLPEDVSITIHEYIKEADDLTAAFRDLKNDVLYGDAPDILVLTPEDLMRLEKAGGIADLYGLMEAFGGVQPEDFLPNVIEGFTVDGRLPAVTERFSIRTAMAKSRFVPREYENWTPEEAMEFYESMPEGMEFMDCWSNSDLADYMLRCVTQECADVRTGRCDFRSGSFTKLLDFCAGQDIYAFSPDFGAMTDLEMQEFSRREGLKGVSDEFLVFPIDIMDFGSGLAQNTYGFFGMEDFTFVGYPSDSGSGTIASACGAGRAGIGEPLYAVTERSEHKEQAWEVISYLLERTKRLERNENISDGLPVLKEQLQKDYDRSTSYSNSINREFELLWAYGSGETVALTQEQKDYLYDYVTTVKFDPYVSSEIRALTSEEISAALAGERSAEQCADILNDRISTYLSENS